MAKVFGLDPLNKFNTRAETAKRQLDMNRGGGDPDLFVYKGNGRRVRLFVEVKHKDKLSTKQKLVFRLIRKYLGCPVKIVRTYSRKVNL
jgi:hypothetical protein